MENEQEITTFDKERSSPPPSTGLVLTPEQSSAVDLILQWFKGEDMTPQEFKLGGYAGTGKTTIIRVIRDALARHHAVQVCAFTGKAVNVLHRKGIRADTIHSLIYECEKIKGVLHWHLRTSLPDRPDLFIIDEASMISKDLYNDLRSFGIKILFVGDPGQLEPVGDNPNLMAVPDVVLSKIHRQAEKSPIIRLANTIRQGGSFPGLFTGDELTIMGKSSYDMRKVKQLICATNKTRRQLNDMSRRLLQLEPKTLTKGEKIIVLKNNRGFGLFNGMILFVEDIIEDVKCTSTDPSHFLINAKDEVGTPYNNIRLWREPFITDKILPNQPEIPRMKTEGGAKLELVHADYGYVITCHKSQGSEWESVLVYDEVMPAHIWSMARWRYTAITRASKQLIYCL